MSSTAGAERLPYVPAEEQMRQQRIQPIVSAEELVFPGVWESDEDLCEFVADLYASRRASMS